MLLRRDLSQRRSSSNSCSVGTPGTAGQKSPSDVFLFLFYRALLLGPLRSSDSDRCSSREEPAGVRQNPLTVLDDRMLWPLARGPGAATSEQFECAALQITAAVFPVVCRSPFKAF